MAETVTGGAAAHAKVGRYVGRIARPLSHPFLLLVVGALLTSLLLPSITRRWQDHQRRLDLQDQLVSQITRETTKFIVAAHRARDDPDYSESSALEAWRVERAVIQSRLRGYYPTTGVNARMPGSIADRWLHYVVATDAFYQLAIRPKGPPARKNEELLLSELSDAGLANGARLSNFHDAVRRMENGLSLFVGDILEQPPRI